MTDVRGRELRQKEERFQDVKTGFCGRKDIKDIF